ncbi:LytTR family DNA-binding domain-containing protein [Salinihabitans flavidus]|nr:LytTR family DNA-binding domain-containing protein [Salinihabitans flavidus]
MRDFSSNLRRRLAPGRTVIPFFGALALLTLTGPFGTFWDFGFWERLTYWSIMLAGPGVFIHVCTGYLFGLAGQNLLSKSAFVLLGSALGAIPGAAVVIFSNAQFRDHGIDASLFPQFWFYVTMIGTMITGVQYLAPAMIERRLRSEMRGGDAAGVRPDALLSPPANVDDTPGALPRLYHRLRPNVREGRIISLSMQDHYVAVTTETGTELILMRLSDAIDLLDGHPGARTHRSHWAAQAFAQSLSRDGRRHLLHLSDGRSLPVSASYRKMVLAMLEEKEAGLAAS